MLAHSFNRFYVVTKFILPTSNDLKFSQIKYDERCEHLQIEKGCPNEAKEDILNLITYCRKIRPFVQYYKDQTNSFNHAALNILKKKRDRLKFSKIYRMKRKVWYYHITNFRFHRLSI